MPTRSLDSDATLPAGERLPSSFLATFLDDGGRMHLLVDGVSTGDSLTDARRVRDGYRFHDAMHLAFAVRLGWSPVLRALLGRKRRSNPLIDECEDGGRARMVEESVCHLVHIHRRDFGDDEWDVPVELIMRMVRGFEVERCSADQWTGAIRLGLEVRDRLDAAGGGIVACDRVTGKLVIQ